MSNRPAWMPPPASRSKSEFVYFVQAERLGLIKIGIARSMAQRLSSLRTGSPDKLTVLGVVPTDQPNELEKLLHQAFHYFRSHGEWFTPTPEMLAFIREDAMTLEDYEREFLGVEPPGPEPVINRPVAPTDRTYSPGAKGRMERYLAARGLDR